MYGLPGFNLIMELVLNSITKLLKILYLKLLRLLVNTHLYPFVDDFIFDRQILRASLAQQHSDFQCTLETYGADQNLIKIDHRKTR